MSGDAAEVLGPPSSRAEKLKEAWRLAGGARLAFEAAKASAARATVLREARAPKPDAKVPPPVLQLCLTSSGIEHCPSVHTCGGALHDRQGFRCVMECNATPARSQPLQWSREVSASVL